MNRLCIACLAIVFCISGIEDAAASGFALLDLGIAAGNREDNATAITALTEALSAPDLAKNLRAVALLNRGRAHARQNDLPGAMEDFSAAIKADPTYVLAYIARANIYVEQSRFPLAIADLSAARQLRPHLGALLFERCNAYSLAGNLDAAVSDCTELVNAVPDADGHILRARIFMRVGNAARAKDDIDWLWRHHAHDAGLYRLRADYALSTGDVNNALENYEAARDKAPHNAWMMMDVGIAQWLSGRPQRASSSFVAALKENNPPIEAALWKTIADGVVTQDDFMHFDLSRWPGPIATVYLGTLKPEAAMDGARTAPPGKILEDAVCQADFFLGEWSLLQHASDTALLHMKNALSDCASGMSERQAAGLAYKALLPAVSLK